VILVGDGTNDAIVIQGNFIGRRNNITFTNYLNIFTKASGNVSGIYTGCVFNGGNLTHAGSGDMRASFTKCVFINCNISFLSNTNSGEALEMFDECIFINTSVSVNTAYAQCEMKSCYGDANSSAEGFSLMENCVWEGTITDVDTETNVTSEDPLFLGSPERLELVVQPQSPLVGGGIAGINIGNVKTGSLQNSSTQEWGLFPAVNNDTQFNVNQALVVFGATVGDRESQQIDIGQVVRSPTMRLNGLSDFLNSVPDFNNALVNPNSLTVELAYAGEDLVFTAFKPFRWNEQIVLDNTNKSPGS
jgi:hypothetical protein